MRSLTVIRNMGYNVETNAEYLDSMKSQFAIDTGGARRYWCGVITDSCCNRNCKYDDDVHL